MVNLEKTYFVSRTFSVVKIILEVGRLLKAQNLGYSGTFRTSRRKWKLIICLHRYGWMVRNFFQKGVTKIWIEAALVGLTLALNQQLKRNNRGFWSLPASGREYLQGVCAGH